MHKKWKKTGENIYNLESLNKYLEQSGAYDEKQIKKYGNGRNFLTEMKTNLNRKKVLKAMISFVKSVTSHKKIVLLYWYIFLYNLNK